MSKGNFNVEIAPELLAGLLVGAVVHISKFPMNHEIPGVKTTMQEPPGDYFVDSVVLHENRSIEVGVSDLQTREHIDYFDHEDLHIRVISKGVFWIAGPTKPSPSGSIRRKNFPSGGLDRQDV